MSKIVIDRFIGEYSFLNNFYLSTIRVDGNLYQTIEHAYQAHKTVDPSIKEMIRNAPDPMTAKKLGKGIILRDDWDLVKVDLMRKFIRLKFENPLLREMLISTGKASLVQVNLWNDKFWGVCRGVGENWLGKILMETRDEIFAEVAAENCLYYLLVSAKFLLR